MDTAAEIDVERPTDVRVVKAVLVGDPTQAIPGSRLRWGTQYAAVNGRWVAGRDGREGGGGCEERAKEGNIERTWSVCLCNVDRVTNGVTAVVGLDPAPEGLMRD